MVRMVNTRKGISPQHEDPSFFINRELSWINFNIHVLHEAADLTHPVLERVKFLSIFSNNLDEFFMVRVSGLQRQLSKGAREAPPDGMTPSMQLDAIHASLTPVLEEQALLWRNDLIPSLAEKGIFIHNYCNLPPLQQDYLRRYFEKEIFPCLTPLAFDRSHPFPFISNLSLNLATILRDPVTNEEFFTRIKVPTNLYPRLIEIDKDSCPDSASSENVHFVFLEDLIAANLDLLFPGFEVVSSSPFRVTRDADFEIEEDDASDLLTAIEESVELRRIGLPVRIEVDPSMSERTSHMISEKLGMKPDMFYRFNAPLGLADLMVLMKLDRPELKDTPFPQYVPPGLQSDDDIFKSIKEHDYLLYHPYDSFSPVLSFLRQAANDPDVLAIKMTLYRVGQNAPVVDALMEARENDIDVTAMIELKARFDEENNIGWARALEREGVHVVYGVSRLKVHSKLCMVVRREANGIVRYVHLGTGNYNVTTSRIYTDFGLFTCDPDIGADVADLFNTITGYARMKNYRKLLVAPTNIRSFLLQKIEREITRQMEYGDGSITFKMNALVDREFIDAFYRASQAGVKILLQVRGICCLRPGIPGISENITVSTIVGRFLEHTRCYIFNNGGNIEIYLGSADLMPRNLNRRIEVLFPVEDEMIKHELIHTIIPVKFHDNIKMRILKADGKYERKIPEKGEMRCNAQQYLIENSGMWHRLPSKLI